MNIVRFVRQTRYVVIIPIIGLALAAAVLFVAGGVGLITFLVRNISTYVSGSTAEVLPIFGLLEHVDQFLIGTVLYITALGLYQLFIQELPMRHWLQVDSGEDLEINIVGVIVVVLAIEFLGAVFTGRQGNYLSSFGIGIAVTIAALALFIAVRHWTEDKPPKLPQVGDQATPSLPRTIIPGETLNDGLPGTLPDKITNTIEHFVKDN
jgi:uncharacterized membrane protein YqhA